MANVVGRLSTLLTLNGTAFTAGLQQAGKAARRFRDDLHGTSMAGRETGVSLTAVGTAMAAIAAYKIKGGNPFFIGLNKSIQETLLSLHNLAQRGLIVFAKALDKSMDHSIAKLERIRKVAMKLPARLDAADDRMNAAEKDSNFFMLAEAEAKKLRIFRVMEKQIRPAINSLKGWINNLANAAKVLKVLSNAVSIAVLGFQTFAAMSLQLAATVLPKLWTAIAGLSKGFMVLSTIAAGVFAKFTKEGIVANSTLEQNQVAFETMLGSTEKAKKLLGEIQSFAAATPFQTDELTAASRNLVAFGIAADQVIPNMKVLGDLASGIGMPIGELAELFGKAKVQGRMFMVDINQLTNRGIPVIEELAKQFGVSNDKVRELVEEGSVGFPHIQRAFMALTGEGGKFKDLMEKQSKTAGGMWSTLKDEFAIITKELTATFMPMIKEALKWMIAMMPKVKAELSKVTTAVFMVAEVVRQNWPAIYKTVVSLWTGFVNIWKSLGDSTMALLGFIQSFSGLGITGETIMMIISNIPLYAQLAFAKVMVWAGEAFDYMIWGWDTVKSWMSNVFEIGVRNAVGWTKAIAQVLWNLVKMTPQFLGFAWDNIKQFFFDFWEIIKLSGTRLWDLGKVIVAALTGDLSGVQDGLVKLFTDPFIVGGKIIANRYSMLAGFISDNIGNVFKDVDNPLQAMVDFVPPKRESAFTKNMKANFDEIAKKTLDYQNNFDEWWSKPFAGMAGQSPLVETAQLIPEAFQEARKEAQRLMGMELDNFRMLFGLKTTPSMSSNVPVPSTAMADTDSRTANELKAIRQQLQNGVRILA